MFSTKISAAAVVLVAAFSFSATGLPASAEAKDNPALMSDPSKWTVNDIKIGNRSQLSQTQTVAAWPQTLAQRDILPMSTGVPIRS